MLRQPVPSVSSPVPSRSSRCRGSVTVLLCAAVVSVGSGEARAENYLQKRLRNTPFDPTTPLRILPRSQPSTSRLGVDEHVYSHYRIDGNGWVWVSQHAAGGPENWQPNGQRASIQQHWYLVLVHEECDDLIERRVDELDGRRLLQHFGQLLLGL